MIDDLVFGENVLWELIPIAGDIPVLSKLLLLDEDGEPVYKVSPQEVGSLDEGTYIACLTTVNEDGEHSFKVLDDLVEIEKNPTTS